ncbi:uncharacterized protein MELLADRAFT_114490 [Melampsora larici-populina 98AG31]|uniref:Uncharacterized protein n=1 Tax=Melampsora larici-populina (strain 98AG31 / pathotype 3-4-7) TaxID=747676 RepID=F4SDN9_MELLP|nr:uncharacterized protein MELLADRAFT_114490 [Melampsora larici-populina 98AG31]EGF97238.1 hypothetical protein MELLADRAFT_114490 [Melampsora larici-populina 98AG31]
MPSQPPLIATLSAILTATSDSTMLHPRLVDGGVAWHKTDTQLVLKDEEGQHVITPLKAYGYILANELLTRGHTYHIHGPVGVDLEDGAAFVRHSVLTQSLVSVEPPQPADLAGKAMLSSVGKVLRVTLDNANKEAQWHFTVQAEHEVFEPEGGRSLRFPITYRFGYFSPELSDIRNIAVNTVMWFQGLVVSKDDQSKQLIIQVLHHGVVVAE